MQPKVSIIIPYYNAGDTIGETMNSVFVQDYENYDVWIINDGSTDQISLDALKQFENNPKVHILHQKNAGPSLARNSAILKSDADYIIPLDSDNLIEPNAISKSIIEIQKLNSDAVFGNYIFFGEKNEKRTNKPYSITENLVYNTVDTCALIKRSVFEKGILYDEKLSKQGLEDWEFWIHFHSTGYKLDYLDFPFIKIRVSNSSRTYEVANKNMSEIREYVYRKHAQLVLKEYEALYYQLKMERESIEKKIASLLLKPYRKIKSINFRSQK